MNLSAGVSCKRVFTVVCCLFLGLTMPEFKFSYDDALAVRAYLRLIQQ